MRRPVFAVLVIASLALGAAGCTSPEPVEEPVVDVPTLESLGATATVVEYLTTTDQEMLEYLCDPEVVDRLAGPAKLEHRPASLTIHYWSPVDGNGDLAREFPVERDGYSEVLWVVIKRDSPDDPWRVFGEGGAP